MSVLVLSYLPAALHSWAKSFANTKPLKGDFILRVMLKFVASQEAFISVIWLAGTGGGILSLAGYADQVGYTDRHKIRTRHIGEYFIVPHESENKVN